MVSPFIGAAYQAHRAWIVRTKASTGTTHAPVGYPGGPKTFPREDIFLSKGEAELHAATLRVRQLQHRVACKQYELNIVLEMEHQARKDLKAMKKLYSL